jgi:hypothetical protein
MGFGLGRWIKGHLLTQARAFKANLFDSAFEESVVLALRFLVLIALGAFEHLGDGLAYPALAAALLLGWRGIRFYWLAAPILLSAFAAQHIYANVATTGKLGGALGNIWFELMVFTFLSILGYVAGLLLRPRRSVG